MLNEEAETSVAQAIRLGEANPQSSWLFESAGEELPGLRKDCRPTVGEVCAEVPIVGPDTPLSAAIRRQRETRSALVVVKEQEGILGVLSDRMPRVAYLLSANIEDMLGTLLQWEHLAASLPVTSLNGLELSTEPSGMRFVSGAAPGPQDVLVTGPVPENPAALLAQKPAAIIVVGPQRCPALEEQQEVPVFGYHGSEFAFCASLGGCIPCRSAIDTEFPTINHAEILSESRSAIANADYGLMVVDDSQGLLGVVTPQQLAEASRPQVALVDHFEKAQSVRGIEEATITAIIDHHRIGDIETSEPVEIDCRIWGSTASILFARCRESGLAVPAGKAKLLLGALIADTLLLQSPTTRTQDRRIAEELATIAEVDLREFGLEVLRRNDRLMSTKPAELVRADCKRFTHGNYQFLAAQIETVDLSLLSDERAGELEHALEADIGGADFAALMITDVLTQTSRISIVGADPKWGRKFLPEDSTGFWIAEGYVSRKKQIIPHLLERIDA